jgi:hypothetical protein
MQIRQISIFIENRTGRLAAITTLLGEAGINIRALSLADTSDFGILRLIVDKPDEACVLLKEQGFTYSLTDVVAVEVPDKPGGLAKVLNLLNTGGINVEYMYAFVEKSPRQAVLVFRFDDMQAAVKALTAGGIRVMKNAEVLNL